jgi:hypothetical protein
MITNEVWILAGTAVAAGTFHTLVGPERYLPCIAMAGLMILLSGLAVQFLGL